MNWRWEVSIRGEKVQSRSEKRGKGERSTVLWLPTCGHTIPIEDASTMKRGKSVFRGGQGGKKSDREGREDKKRD